MRNVSQSGDVKSVVKKARDGKEVSNADAVAKAAAAALASGKSFDGTFEYRTIKATWKERTIADGAENLAYPAAPGEKWIDVNLDRHTMTACVGAKKVTARSRWSTDRTRSRRCAAPSRSTTSAN